MTTQSINIAILGASGYTGAELIRLLALHPNSNIKALSAERRAGEDVSLVFPHLSGVELSRLQRVNEIDFDEIDVVFCCLPHGTTHEIVSSLPARIKVIDLSPDFRLSNVANYEAWYGPHKAPRLQETAIYGLPEIRRGMIESARLVGNPGCYPTSVILPLAPILKHNQIEEDRIVIDSKSGVSGAGRAEKEANLFCEVAEGIHAYGVGSHRHMPEIEQELSLAAGKNLKVSFTPHLMPMSRGILSSIYVCLKNGQTVSDLKENLVTQYRNEPFIRVLESDALPATRHVRGSNYCLINVFKDRLSDRAIILSVIDNLVKGASGQAIQNMNLMCGLDEDTGIAQQPLFP